MPPNFVPIMHNARFATLIHILTLLAKSPGEWLSSDCIAESIRINPVIVRKELGVMHQLGWVASKKGKQGGSLLVVPPSEISLADIFKAVLGSHVLGKKNSCQGTECPVGKGMDKALEQLFVQTDQIVVQSMESQSLQEFVGTFE